MDEVAELKEEIRRLKEVVKELTAALKVLADKDERAKAFIDRVESLLTDATEQKNEAVAALEEERK